MQHGLRSLLPVALATHLAIAAALTVGAQPASAATDYVAKCAVNLRANPSTSATIKGSLSTGDGVTVSGTVSGGSWSATCNGSIAGNDWYAVTAVNGQSVSSLYGVSTVYAATGFFRRTSYLEGIDVSRWQGSIDWAKVKGAGKRFVIAKATEGIGFRDANYTANRSGAMAAGLKVTAYHFARPDLNPTDPTGEADWFVDNMNLVKGMLVPALDLERSGGMSISKLQDWVAAWLDRVYERTGVRAMIYVSPAFWKTYLGDTTMFAADGYSVLWVAHWGVSAPTVPANNWGGKSWTFWQYTSDGSVPGIDGRVDLDRFNGTDLTRVTYGADFDVDWTSRSVKQGSTATFDVAIIRTFFTLPVTLSVSGLPAGATATLDPSSTSGSSATVTVKTSKSGTVTPVGSYSLTIKGTGNGWTRTDGANLTVTDGIAPTMGAPGSKLYTPTAIGGGAGGVRTKWSASDPSGIDKYALQRKVDGGSWTSVSLSSATATSIKQALEFGTPYRYRSRATDGNGNTSAWSYGPTFEPRLTQQSSSSVSYGGSWTTGTDSSYSGDTVRYSKSSGSWASYTFTGAAIAWVAERGPTRGSAKVYVDGDLKATVDLYSSSYTAKQVVFVYNWSSNGGHTIKIVCQGTAGHARVDIDAFMRLYQT